MPWDIKKEGEEFVVMKKDGKVVGKHKTHAEAVAHMKALYANVKENVSFEFTTTCEVTESKEGVTSLLIGGIALEECISENNRKYTINNIIENDKKQFKWLVGHPKDNVEEHIVGKGELVMEAGKLKHKGKIMNTAKHPDVCNLVKEGLLGPSIHASAKRIIKEEDGVYSMEGLSIDGIGLVAFQGVKSASIDYAISESFDKWESVKIDEKDNNDTKGETIMVEEIKQPVVETVSKDQHEAVLKELNAMKEAKKSAIVESIVSLNKDLKKEELIKESEEKLNLILAYEQKLSVKPKVQESVSVVETKEEVKKSEDVIVESKGDLIISESAYKKFNEEIMSRIR